MKRRAPTRTGRAMRAQMYNNPIIPQLPGMGGFQMPDLQLQPGAFQPVFPPGGLLGGGDGGGGAPAPGGGAPPPGGGAPPPGGGAPPPGGVVPGAQAGWFPATYSSIYPETMSLGSCCYDGNNGQLYCPGSQYDGAPAELLREGVWQGREVGLVSSPAFGGQRWVWICP